MRRESAPAIPCDVDLPEARLKAMTNTEREGLIRQYAAGDLAWSTLREKGFDGYLDLLAGLGDLGLRPPVAPMDGPNKAARERGRAFIREALKIAP
jgi:hypothetical protein